MKTIHGATASAIIFTANTTGHSIDDYAIAQIQNLCSNPSFKNCKIRVMPDVHPGKVGTIGFTSTLGSSIMPNIIGVDIGCGVTLAEIKGRIKDYRKLDTVIRENIPSGFAVRSKVHHKARSFDFSQLCCVSHIRKEKAQLSLGSLGSGNHFIEIDRDEDENYYLTVHSGSRHLGREVTEHYLREGHRYLRNKGIDIPYELTSLEGRLMDDYLHDLDIVRKYASLNREIIIDEICSGMKFKIQSICSCAHNYVDFSMETPYIRKGAISAKSGEKVVIPVNMRDGIILGTGLGNPEWNYSAPHGAGRIVKRSETAANYTLSSYKREMKGIYSTCISKDTLDEAPFAYRCLDEIMQAIGNTVSIEKIIRPVYSFKAG